MNIITDNTDIWWDGLVGTLILFFGGGLLALVLGIIVGGMRVSPIPIRFAVRGCFPISSLSPS